MAIGSASIRAAAPDTALYVEAVFSLPISQELLSGALDLGILFMPTPHPDLYYETLSDVRYELVSSTPARIETLDLASYVVPDYSPAFLRLHAERLPRLASGLTTVGQSNLALAMMLEMGGASYQPEATARALQADGFHPVEDAPVLGQPVFGAVHIRNRHRKSHRQVLRAMAAAL